MVVLIISVQSHSQTRMVKGIPIDDAFRAQKKGTLSPNTLGGQGANGNRLCESYIAFGFGTYSGGEPTLCINDMEVNIGADIIRTSSAPNWYYGPYNWIFGGNGGYSSGTKIASSAYYITVTRPGVYTMATEDGCWDQILITSTLPASITGSTICTGGSVALNAPVTNANTFGSILSYQWYNGNKLMPGETNPVYNAKQTGSYYAQTTDEFGCVQNVDSIVISAFTPPAKIAITGGSCGQGSLIIDNSTKNIFPVEVDWTRNDSLINTFTNEGTTVAGGNGAGKGLNQLKNPYGIFIDSAKNIYVADHDNNRIVKWAPDTNTGTIVTDATSLIAYGGGKPVDIWLDKYNNTAIAGDQGTVVILSGSVPSPHGDAANSITGRDSILYISSDRGIEKWNPYTNVSSTFSAAANANGIFIDSVGNVYSGQNNTDSSLFYIGSVVKYGASGVHQSTVSGGKIYTQIGAAGGLTVDKKGNIYVGDINNNQVEVWKPGAASPNIIASGYAPAGIKLDNDGNIYVADQTNNRVVRYPAMTVNSINHVTPGVYKAELTYPGGCVVATDSIVVSACTLPLTFLDFTAQLQKNDVVLNWQTAQEINTSYFNIERSIDALHFSIIGKTTAYNSNSKNSYIYTDFNAAALPANKLYYRLQEVDKDGAFANSKIVTINLNIDGWSYTVSPNPVHNMLNVQLKNTTGQINISIIGINGQRLMQQTFTGGGNTAMVYNISNLAAGSYIIQVTSNGTRQQQKFTKL